MALTNCRLAAKKKVGKKLYDLHSDMAFGWAF
jgi:hypothetical protein